MEFTFLRLEDFELSDKTIFLRVDINSPVDPTTLEILDDSRIKAVKETLDFLVESKVVIGSHQSRPGMGDFISLRDHAKILQRHCSQKVKFVDDVIGPQALKMIKELKVGEVLVLENLRICSEEILEDKPEKLIRTHFVKRLSPLFDIYVNDAFAAIHRSQPSLVAFPEVLPSAIGKLMEKELGVFKKVLKGSSRPSIYILGGAKVDDKLPVVENLLENNIADKVLLGGVIAKLFLKVKGCRLSKNDEDELKHLTVYFEKVKKILDNYEEALELPVDLAIEREGKRKDVKLENSRVNGFSFDVGIETIKKYVSIMKKARTIVANGPLGIFEKNGFELGTRTILEEMAKSDAYTVIGGGHLTGMAGIMGISKKISHVSTGGGAMLHLLAGRSLPVLEALAKSAKRKISEKLLKS
ncbi:MAG: phosphoglycerate kinase [Candidatus Bathyarchaeia archaeon]